MKNVINAIVVIAMVLCITMVSLKLDNTIVLGWYVVPGFIQLMNVITDEDCGREEDEYGSN